MGDVNRDMVERELAGQVTPEELWTLERDPKRWRGILLEIDKEIEQKLIERRSHAMYAGPGNHQAMKEFTAWKATAMGYKQKIVARLSQLKEIVRGINQAENPQSSSVWLQMLDELRAIRAILESRGEGSANK